jgi:hypothetical protein
MPLVVAPDARIVQARRPAKGVVSVSDGPKAVTERRVGPNAVRQVTPVASVDNVAL